MTTTTFFIPPVNLMGAGCLNDAVRTIQSYGFRKALIVTDSPLVRLGRVGKVRDLLASRGVDTFVLKPITG